MPSEVRKLKRLQEEKTQLRKLVADLTRNKKMATEVIKKDMTPAGPRDDRFSANLFPSLGPTRDVVFIDPTLRSIRATRDLALSRLAFRKMISGRSR